MLKYALYGKDMDQGPMVLAARTYRRTRVYAILIAFVAAMILGTMPVARGTQKAGEASRCNEYIVLNGEYLGADYEYEVNTILSGAYREQPEDVAQVFVADGCGMIALQSLHALGARVLFWNERIGYAEVLMPKKGVLGLLDARGLVYATVFPPPAQHPHSVPLSEQRVVRIPHIVLPILRVATILPKGGPYFPTHEVGLNALWRMHPQADGRGVRVMVFDGGADLLHPALRVAIGANGKRVPKIADVVVDSVPDWSWMLSPNWVRFGKRFTTTSGTFTAMGRVWVVPKDGTYRFGLFASHFPFGFALHDPHVKSITIVAGVLWDERRNLVWVDTNGDRDFRNQRALEDYVKKQDVDYFGRKVGLEDNRIPFGVKIDRDEHAVFLTIATNPHGLVSLGPLASNRLTGGLYDGAAPNAQIIDARAGYNFARLVQAFARKDVDVIQYDAVYPGDYQAPVIERLIAACGKPIVAADFPHPGTIDVDDYQSPDMLRRNRQITPPYRDAIFTPYYSGYTTPNYYGDSLPAPNGLMNLILGPSTALYAQSRYMPVVVRAKDGRDYTTNGFFGFFGLSPPAPAGYAIGNHMSPTIPVITGILADLIGEAKREHMRYNPQRIMQALLTGSRLLPGFSVAEQGFGLADAAGAWNQLVGMGRADDPHNAMLTSFTLWRPFIGRVYGFAADLARPDVTVRGEISVIRHGGYPGGRTYELSFRGNDGTYRLLDRRVVLTQDQPTRVRFEVHAGGGKHVALLQLRDSKARIVMQEIPLSVRSPDVPVMLAPGIEWYHATIPPLRDDNRFIRLGPEVQAARFDVNIPYTGRADSAAPVLAFPGISLSDEPLARSEGGPVDKRHHVGPMLHIASLVLNDQPGTQSLHWENRAQPEYATPYSDPAPTVPIRGSAVVTTYAVSFTKTSEESVRVSNELADITGKVELYDAKLHAFTVHGIGDLALVNVRQTLPANLSQWRVALTSTRSEWRLGDALLVHCVPSGDPWLGGGGAWCTVEAHKVLAANATLIVHDPPAGEWHIIVRLRERAPQAVVYKLQEAMLVPSVHVIQSSDGEYAHGSVWSVHVPSENSDAQYLAFRIAAGNAVAPNGQMGPSIALTPLTDGAP